MTDNRQRLPDFIIIGAAKSATTWLQRQLQQHPGIFMPNPELHYFSRELERGMDWYASHFAPAPEDSVVGEKTNSYLDHSPSATLIYEAVPEAKLVVQLRNPIERAYSDYCMVYRRGDISSDIERHLAPGGEQAARLLEGGLYCQHLQRFIDRFGHDRLLVTLFDDVKPKPAELLAEVCDHIGVPPFETPPKLEARVKTKDASMVSPTARRMLAPIKGLVAPIRHTAWFRAARNVIARPVDYPALTDDIRQRLAEYYQDDIARLSKLIDRDLTPWITVSKEAA